MPILVSFQVLHGTVASVRWEKTVQLDWERRGPTPPLSDMNVSVVTVIFSKYVRSERSDFQTCPFREHQVRKAGSSKDDIPTLFSSFLSGEVSLQIRSCMMITSAFVQSSPSILAHSVSHNRGPALSVTPHAHAYAACRGYK